MLIPRHITRIFLPVLVLIVTAGCHQRPATMAASAAPVRTPAADEAGGWSVAAPVTLRGAPDGEARGAPAIVTTRIEDLFAGRYAGLDVQRTANGDLSMRLRGAEPLLVIDGMEADPVALIAVHPTAVARIEILRNPTETAVYGSRGVNGVLVVTTRR